MHNGAIVGPWYSVTQCGMRIAAGVQIPASVLTI